jgi:hypothetical protein
MPEAGAVGGTFGVDNPLMVSRPKVVGRSRFAVAAAPVAVPKPPAVVAEAKPAEENENWSDDDNAK